jgi:hypothetical protein
LDKNFNRLLDTLRIVPVGRKLSTADIHSRLMSMGHDVTVRTVQRDLLALAFNLLYREFRELMPPPVMDALQPWFDKSQAEVDPEFKTAV